MISSALCAHCSSDHQGVASIEHQFRICCAHAVRETWHVVGPHHDAALSGPRSLLQDAPHGRFGIVLAETLDRVGRDQAHAATRFKHLRFAGVPVVTVSKGGTTALLCAGVAPRVYDPRCGPGTIINSLR